MLIKIPALVRFMFPNRIWRATTDANEIYLTFDDGPVPGITPWVLDELERFNAKATFFCIGDNVRKHPAIFERIINDGHSIGNHTNNHLNGWEVSAPEYLKNVLLAEQSFSEILATKEQKETRLFRPPYGRLTRNQSKQLQKQNFRIVMWDVLSRDYDIRISTDTCFEKVVKHTRAGSIVVFHDSLKAEKNLRIILPKILKHFSNGGCGLKGLDI